MALGARGFTSAIHARVETYGIDSAGYGRVGFALNFPPDLIARDIRALEPAPVWRWPWSR